MKKWIRLIVPCALLLLLSGKLSAQTLYFPPIAGSNWDTLSPASLGWCEEKIDTLLDYLEDKNSKAFILLKDGKIVIEKYFGTFTADSLWYWASAGKTITGFMTGIAQQEGFLSIDDTSSAYMGSGWTSLTPAQEEKITIRHQLSMTSGLDDGVPDHHCTLPSCLHYLADAGTRWAYHNGPYTLLDSVIESATGQSLNSYTTQKLKLPTGMTGLFYPSGYNNVFVSTPRSMARFGLLMLNKGNWNGNQIMTDTSYFNQMISPSQALNLSYGFLWWLNGQSSFMVPTLQTVFPGPLNPSAPPDMFAAVGKNGQFINVVPSQNLVYIRMGNAPGPSEVPLAMNDTIWQKLNDIFCSTASVADAEENTAVRIFPNPSNGSGTIEVKDRHFSIAVFDLSGRMIFTRQDCFHSLTLNTGGLENGLYHIRIITDKTQVHYGKLMVCHD